MKNLLKFAGLALAGSALATPALAHTGAGSVAGFSAGLIHPLAGFDHLLAMLSVGIWSALVMGRDARQPIWAPSLIFVSVMCVGAGLAFSGLALPAVETGIALSVLVLGLMVATKIRLGTTLGLGVIALFAMLHGHAHGTEAAGAMSAYMAGFTLATASLHLLGVGLGLVIKDVRLVAPLLGSALAAAGAFLIVF